MSLPTGRNDRLVDWWSLVHLLTALGLSLWLGPLVALVILVLWEPLEILVLSPLAEKWWNLTFGKETLRNSLSDIVFDVAGVLLGVAAQAAWFA